MKTTSPIATLLPALILVAGVVLLAAGCTDNRAGESIPGEIGAAGVSEDTATSADGSASAVESRESSLAERERVLQEKEDELARAQADLADSVRALTKKIESAEAVNDETAGAAVPATPVIEEAPPRTDSGAVPTYPRRLGPDARVVSVERPRSETITVELPVATQVAVELLDAVSSETSVAGDPVEARVAESVMRNGLVVIPAGARVSGTVFETVKQKKIGGQARLVVLFDRLTLPSGENVPLEASIVAEGEKQTKKDAATIGGATAGGALLGRILKDDDRDKGTVVGAILGAAVGAAVASSNEADAIVMEPGTVAVAALDVPVRIAVRDPAATELAQMD